MNQELTILSVSFHSAPYLIQNYELTKFLNPKNDQYSWNWLVVENTPEGFDDKININYNEFTVIEGDSAPNVPKTIKGSYHHAAGLSKGLKRIKSRFLLILDPDFYICRKNWINDIIQYMDKKKLDFFGVPWHPKHTSEYRYFPCVHCLFVDLERINIKDLNFTPTILKSITTETNILPENKKKSTTNRNSFIRYSLKFLKRSKKIHHLLDILHYNISGRRRIGSSKDTGNLFYKYFANKKNIGYELATPVYKFDKKTTSINPIIYLWFSKMIDKILPDHYSFIPKRKDYFTTKGFKEFGFKDINSLGYEEFIWKNNIFSFHQRKYSTDKFYSPEKQLNNLKIILNNIIKKTKPNN